MQIRKLTGVADVADVEVLSGGWLGKGQTLLSVEVFLVLAEQDQLLHSSGGPPIEY